MSIQSNLEELNQLYSQLEGRNMKRTLLAEVKRFVSFVLSANGKISDGEPEFLGQVLGRDILGDELANYIAAENLTGPEFAHTVPPLYKAHIHEIAPSMHYVAFFNALGREAVLCDRQADMAEVTAYEDYIAMLADYYNEKNPDAPAKMNVTPSKDLMEAAQNQGKEAGESLEDLLAELDGLIGLHSVKRNVYSLLHLQSIQMEREKRGLPKIPMTNHLVFTGNPGTGKTTVARLIGRIYHKIGLLPSDNFVEVDRSGMVAGYVGQTAIAVKNVMDTAKGGVLFIDEAYALSNGMRGDFGKEAIETLLKRMEDDRENMVVIVAGYPELMEDFIASNPGLRSRFRKKIYFPDYSPEELLEILEYMVKKHHFTISEKALDYAYTVLEEKYNTRSEDFANAREVRNFFESAVVSQADRLYGKETLTDEELCRLEESDFRQNEIMLS